MSNEHAEKSLNYEVPGSMHLQTLIKRYRCTDLGEQRAGLKRIHCKPGHNLYFTYRIFQKSHAQPTIIILAVSLKLVSHNKHFSMLNFS